MQNESHDELIRQATKGDKTAMDQLFAEGEKLSGDQRFEDAASAFKDAAVAYRVSAFRNLARAEEAEAESAWKAIELQIGLQWIKQNPAGLGDVVRHVEGIDSDQIRKIVLDVLNKQTFTNIGIYLQRTLSGLGVEFSSPGGSIQRHIWYLVVDVFGVSARAQANQTYFSDPTSQRYSPYLDELSVRIGIDQIADEVEKRFTERSVES